MAIAATAATRHTDKTEERAESDFGQDKVSAVLALVCLNYRGRPKGSLLARVVTAPPARPVTSPRELDV